LLGAVFTAAFFMLLTVKAMTLAVISGLLAVAMIIVWMWSSDPRPLRRAEIGHGIKVPTYVSGPLSHSWWAMVILLLVAGSLYLAYVFSYLYLWTVSPQVWPKGEQLPSAVWPVASALLLIGSSAVMFWLGRSLPTASRGSFAFVVLVAAAVLALCGSVAVEACGHWRVGLRPDADAHGAMAYMASFLQLQLVLALVVMAGFTIARRLAGMLNRRRRNVFDNLALLWHYTVGQGLLGLLLIHGFPRLAG
jgi:cytochrome c oxidase subunit I+III